MDETAAAVCELLEAAVHVVLYTRGVYPAALFERRLKYGVPVRVSRHPGVNEYVAGVVRALHAAILRSEAARVVIAVVRAADEAPIERFVFEVGLLAALGDSLPELERGLASFLVKLNAAGASLGRVDPAVERSFRVLLHLDAPPRSGERLQTEWVPCEGRERLPVSAPRLVPLRSLDTEQVVMQLFVEERGA